MNKHRNCHKGETIYVIGSGKSLDYVDPAMFDGQITIGVNQVYKKLIPTYLVRKELQNRSTILKECGAKTHHFWHKAGQPVHDGENVTYFVSGENRLGKGPPVLKGVPRNGLIASWSTITSAIHLAAHMGAKIIILVGHDCVSIDGKCNFKGYHTASTRGIRWGKGKRAVKKYRKWLSMIERDTASLRVQLKARYGCHIVSLNPFASLLLEGHKVS